MCGICGVYAYAATPRVDEELLVAMSGRMAHRGPDDSGTFLSRDRQVGFGFRRLSIVDLSPAGHQPMANADGSVVVVFNGEIYNHADHRPRLLARGYRYRGHSDTETLLHLYEEHGDDCVHHLRGMFAFAIWDERRRRLLLARDRMGVKPLYYSDQGGVFTFASEIKGLLAYPRLSRELDLESLEGYLTFMVPPAPRTMFRGVRKLAPAHRLIVDASGLREERYWDPFDAPSPPPRDEAECVERVRALLDESVRLRLMSDVPVGAFLSGGIDSSTIVALMAKHSSSPVNTFTVGYKDAPALNELEPAREIARTFGARHHEVMIDGRDMVEYMPKLVHTQDEPIGDPVCVPLYYVSQLAQGAGVKVIQVGEGADELFCGYPSFIHYLREERLWARIRGMLPERLARGGYAAAAGALRALRRAGELADLLDRRGRGQPAFWGGAIAYSGRTKAALLASADEGALTRRDLESVQAHREEARRRVPDLDALGVMTYLELKHRLPELLLMRVDKVTMSVSLEARVPFLDQRLVESVLPLALSTKVDGLRPKHLLKKVVASWLPRWVIDRPKQGFPAPVRAWFQALPAGAVRAVLLDGALARRGLFDRREVESLLSGRKPGRRDWSAHVWMLYNLSLWYEHWIEGRPA
jgi:asparagine synthase (glutamine-hydrolysing)